MHVFKMAAGSHAILYLIWLMLDHPRSAIAGLSLVLKVGLYPIYNFGDIAIFIFCRFRLKLPIHAHFWEVLEAYMSPKYRYNPQKNHPCAETRPFSHKS